MSSLTVPSAEPYLPAGVPILECVYVSFLRDLVSFVSWLVFATPLRAFRALCRVYIVASIFRLPILVLLCRHILFDLLASFAQLHHGSLNGG